MKQKRSVILSAILLAIISVSLGCATIPGYCPEAATPPKPLTGITICIDPGHGATARTDSFRVGPTGEREEWINLRVAKYLKKYLVRAGANVLMTRETDTDVNLAGRAALAVNNHADFFISLHHNGTRNDPDVNFPLIYFWGEAPKNPASVDLARSILPHLVENLELQDAPGTGIYSDWVIYSRGTDVLRKTYPHIPGIIGEPAYFTNPAAELQLKNRTYNKLEAKAYYEGILEYVRNGLPKTTLVTPTGDERLGASNPAVIFELTDGLDGTAFQPETIQVFVDDHAAEHIYDPSTGHLTVMPEVSGKTELKIQVFGRNLKGNALHPRILTVKTEAAYGDPVEKEWRTRFDKAEALRQEAANEIARGVFIPGLLEEAIANYQRSLDVSAHHPFSDQAEYYIGECYEVLPRTLENEEAAFKAYKRVVNFYPSSPLVPAAENAITRLESWAKLAESGY